MTLPAAPGGPTTASERPRGTLGPKPTDAQRRAEYEPGELDELQLAYAITIHKSQGSEFPCIIVPLSMAHFVMLQRSLIYTGVTRGKKLVVVVGESKALGMAVRQTNVRKRWTGLQQRLVAPAKL